MRLRFDEPLAWSITQAIQVGDTSAVEQLLRQNPGLASARIDGRRGGSRTLLHLVTDWPGFFPNGPESVRLLVTAGADVNATTEGHAPESPLHWAASSDDVDVALALVELGAHLEMPGGSIGTPLDNAVGYGCWQVARLLVARGARVERMWHAAALGLLDRLLELMGDAPSASDINHAFYQACSGGQRRTAELLLARGAEIDFVPEYSKRTPLAACLAPETRRDTLATWLREHGAR